MTGPYVGDASVVPAVAVVAAVAGDVDRGLTTEEAGRRLAQHGPNELRTTPPTPWWRVLLGQFQDPLVHLLGVAIAVSLAAWLAEGVAGLPIDALVIAAILVANAAIGWLQEERVADAVAALASLTATTAAVLRDGEVTLVPAKDVVVGDLLVLGEGDAVAADARVLGGSRLTVLEAALTGESVPVVKDPQPLERAAPLAERRNMVFGGCAVASGSGRALVTATGMDTEMGAIAALLDSTEAEVSPLQREIGRVSRAIGLAVIVIAVVVMATLALVNDVDSGADVVAILLLGVSLAVAAVPEGLPAVLSLVLAIGVRAMARRQAVVKALHAVETLGSASVVCSDKTGTLTRNEMTLRRVVLPGGEVDPLADEAVEVLLAGAIANNAVVDPMTGTALGDPTEAALAVAASRHADATSRLAAVERVLELPFTSERKLMSAVTTKSGSDDHHLFTKGAPDVLLERCSHARVGDEEVPLDPALRAQLGRQVDDLSMAAYRTLGVARRRLGRDATVIDESQERDLVFLGLVGLIDPPRDEVPPAVAEAQRAGIRVIMITGDHPATALRIATDLGIVGPDARVLTGAQLDALTDEELDRQIEDVSVFARVTPAHKLRIVDALQAHDLIVAMTGDGVNDAPALRSADIGVAMGRAGTEVAKEASTMILGDDNFATIIAAVRQGRVIFDNIRKFLRYLLSSNMGEVATVFLGAVLAPVLGLTEASAAGVVVVPLLATQILWINLVTDSAPALALGVDPEIDDVMARPPRPPTRPMLDGAMWGRIVLVGVTMAAVTLATIDLFLPGGLIEGRDDLATARTAAFSTLVLAQLVNALESRSETRSLGHGLLSNRWLLGALLLGVALQVAVVEVPFLQTAFGTVALDAEHWAWSVGLALLVAVPVELEKAWRRLR
ncbi:MAG: cation-translocating P-type ATPase [Nocardioidaceae bacterium]